jgi:hypothetical protein
MRDNFRSSYGEGGRATQSSVVHGRNEDSEFQPYHLLCPQNYRPGWGFPAQWVYSLESSGPAVGAPFTSSSECSWALLKGCPGRSPAWPAEVSKQGPCTPGPRPGTAWVQPTAHSKQNQLYI